MNASELDKATEGMESSEEKSEKHGLSAWVRDNYVYTFLEGRAVRAWRKEGAALYTHVSPFVPA